MGENTKIEWTDHTFNPWRGCSKVHTGCANCYAERGAKRNPGTLGVWGDHGTRVVASEDMWKQPLKWDAAAEKEGVRRRVFCASFADVFEDWNGWVLDHSGAVVWWCNDCRIFERIGDSSHGACCGKCGSGNGRQATLADVRERLFKLIDDTPHLDWLLVTKRPENIRRMTPAYSYHACETGDCPHDREFECDQNRGYRDNVWLLTSISDQATADMMIPELLKCRDLVPVLGVSAEPLLGEIDLLHTLVYQKDYYCCVCRKWYDWPDGKDHCPNCGEECVWEDNECPQCNECTEAEMICPECGIDGGNGGLSHTCCCEREIEADHGIGLDWVIVGGESGPKSRGCRQEWIQSIVDQCRDTNTACFVKQVGKRYIGTRGNAPGNYGPHAWRFRDPKGGDPAEWPETLRVREFPRVAISAK